MARRSWRYLTLVLVAGGLAVAAVALAGELSLRQTGDGPMCRGERATIVGTAGVDRLVGTPRRDVIVAGPGGDVVLARGGNDVVCDREGADRVIGGRGNDKIGGGSGADRLTAGPGNDLLAGRRGTDTMLGGRGNDRLFGERGDDALRGNAGDDLLAGGAGRDSCIGGPGTDMMVDCESGDQGSDLPAPSPGGGQPPGGPPPISNRAPTGVSLSAAVVAENEPIGTTVGSLSAGDPDPGDTHSFALVPGAGSDDNGSFQIVGTTLRTNAVFDYEAKSTYTVRIRATDFGTPAGQIVRTFTITVSDANEAPAGLALSDDTLPENEPVGTDVGELSVSDPDAGQQHTFTLVAGVGDADNAKFSISGSTLEVAQVLDFEAQPSYSVRVRATDSGSPAMWVEREFTITVTDTLEPPTADSKSASTDEDAAVTVTLSASDPEGDDVASFATTTSATSHGTLGPVGAIACGGSPKVCTADVQFTPDVNFNGLAGFSYTASDGANNSLPANVSITVNPVNDAPTANPGSRSTNEDTPLALNLAALVSDVETADADLSYEIVTAPAHGTATATTYTPDADYNGPDSLTYRVTDRGDPDNCASAPCDAPETSTTETVSITVDPVNDAPTANAGSRSTDEDAPLALNLAALVSDVETADADLSYEIVTAPAHGTATATTYTPAADYNGPDSFSYRVTDRGDPDGCAGAPCDAPETSTTETVSITVDPVNDAPTANAGSRSTDEDTPLALNLAALVGDVETADADLSYEIVTAPAHGTATATTYTPAADYNGPDSFSYRVTDRGDPDGCAGAPCDAAATSTTETVSITVAPVNDVPQASPLTDSVDEDGSLPVELAALVSDVETGDGDLTYTIVTPPSHGNVSGSGSSRTYTPAADFNGSDSFSYQVTDRGDPDNCSSAPCDAPETSTTETVSITVNAVNDAPVNLLPAGPVSVVQETDTPLSGISVGDVDAGGDDVELTLSVEHGTLTVDTTVLGGVGLVQVAGNGTTSVAITASLAQINATLADADGLVYRGDSGYTGPDTLSVTTDDLGNNGSGGAQSDTDTLALNVTPPNAAPVAAGQSVSTDEDTAKTITLSASDADGDDPLSFATGTPSHGSLGSIGPVTCTHLTPNVCTADVVYTPNANYNGPDSFTFTANDAIAVSAAATVSITVNPVNDGPQLAGIEAGALAYTENESAKDITASTTVADVDSANFDTGTLTVDYSVGGTADDRLEIRNIGTGLGQIGVSGSSVSFEGTAIGSFTGGTGTVPLVVTFNANATVPAVQALVRAITYRNVSDAPSTAARTVRFVVTDGDGATSATATRAITLSAANDAPVVTTSAGSTAYTEGAPATTIDAALTVTDADDTNLESGQVRISSGFQAGDELVFSTQNGITGNYNPGTGVLSLTGPASVANYQTALRSIQFRSTNVNPVTAKTVEFRLNDGDADSNAATKTIAVTPVNSAPQVGAGGTLNYIENDPATAVHSGLTLTEIEGDGIGGASVSITVGFQSGQDVLAWTDNNLADNIVLDALNSSTQTIALTGMDTAANYQAALRAVTYQNTSESPATTSRTATFSATDVLGATGTGTRTIAVASVDDPPTAVNDSATVLEDAAATAITVLTNDTDVDAGPRSVASVTQPANGTVAITGGGTGLTYQPNANYCNTPPGTTLSTFTYTLNGGSSATVSVTVTCVNDAPVADDETFDGANGAIGNTSLVVNDPDDGAPALGSPKKTISGDILAGDSDIDGPGPLTVTAGTFATNDGGSVTIEADGDFTYINDPADSCADTSDFFDYTVSDQNPAGPGPAPGTDTGRVTIAVAGCVWYVNNDDPAGNSGTSRAPFDTLAQAETASLANHTVFVFDGNNTSTGYDGNGYTMNAGERLIGEHEGLTVDPDQGGPLAGQTLHPANPGAHPTLTATGADVIDLDDANEVRGFNIDPLGAGGGIAGGTGDVSGTIDDVNITDSGTAGTQPGLELDTTTGTFAVSNFTVSTNGATGVRLNNAGTVTFAPTGNISITSANAAGLIASGTGLGTSTFDAITVTGSTSGAVNLTNTTGTTTFGDLALTTTSGATAAFALSNAGTVSVPAAGTANVSATGGPAVDVTGTAGATLAFDAVSSTTSTTDGINLAGLGAGTFSAASGTIAGAAGIAFDLDGGSGDVTYPGALNNGAGQTAEITGRSGGAVTLSGAIADTNDAGGGINLASNTGGTTTFSNASKVINSVAGTAVAMASSDGHTITLSGGGLDVDTTTGAGISANNSGTLVVSGTGNTIDSISATALNVTNTDIGAAGATFQSLSSGNSTVAADPANGIVLNNTGTAVGNGGLVVTGTGGVCTAATPTCTGGTIQSLVGADNSSFTPVGTGIVLTSTRGTSLSSMRVRNASNYGIRGNQLTNFTLSNSLVDGTNGTNEATPFSDGSISFDTILGTNSITGSEISGGWQRNIRVDHASGVGGGTMTLNVTGNNIHDTVGTAPDDGVFVEAENNDNYTVNVANNTLKNHGGDHVNVTMINSATINVSITGNTLENPELPVRLGGGILVFGASWNGTGTYTVSNNSILRNRQGGAIHMNKGSGTATMSGSVTNNSIGTTGVNKSGSIEASGIVIGARGAGGTHTTLIEDNNVFGWNDRAIILENGEGNPTLNATVRGNTANTFDSINGLHGLHVDMGIIGGDAGSVCLDAGGAVAADRNHLTLAGNEAAGGADIRVRRGQAVNLRMPGYAGGADDDAAVTTYLSGRNDVTTLNVTSPGTGTYSGGAAACPLP